MLVSESSASWEEDECRGRQQHGKTWKATGCTFSLSLTPYCWFAGQIDGQTTGVPQKRTTCDRCAACDILSPGKGMAAKVSTPRHELFLTPTAFL